MITTTSVCTLCTAITFSPLALNLAQLNRLRGLTRLPRIRGSQPARQRGVEVQPSEVPPSGRPTSEFMPFEALPTKVPLSHHSPSEAMPSEVPPSDHLPSDAVPSVVPPSDHSPSEVVPSEVMPSEVMPSDHLPSEATPSDDSPSEVPSSDHSPSEAMPADVWRLCPAPPTRIPPPLPPKTPGLPRHSRGPVGCNIKGTQGAMLGSHGSLQPATPGARPQTPRFNFLQSNSQPATPGARHQSPRLVFPQRSPTFGAPQVWTLNAEDV